MKPKCKRRRLITISSMTNTVHRANNHTNTSKKVFDLTSCHCIIVAKRLVRTFWVSGYLNVKPYCIVMPQETMDMATLQRGIL